MQIKESKSQECIPSFYYAPVVESRVKILAHLFKKQQYLLFVFYDKFKTKKASQLAKTDEENNENSQKKNKSLTGKGRIYIFLHMYNRL